MWDIALTLKCCYSYLHVCVSVNIAGGWIPLSLMIRQANLPFIMSFTEEKKIQKLMTMATRVAARYASRTSRRPFSSGSGKILSEEEKAAENAYFKVSCFNLFLFQVVWFYQVLV